MTRPDHKVARRTLLKGAPGVGAALGRAGAGGTAQPSEGGDLEQGILTKRATCRCGCRKRLGALRRRPGAAGAVLHGPR